MLKYILLSCFVESGIGGGHWVRDMAMPKHVLRHGINDGTFVDGIDSAAAIFANLLAQKEFGENATACIVRRDYSPDERSGIFDMTLGTPNPSGGHYLEQEMRFAVKIAKR